MSNYRQVGHLWPDKNVTFPDPYLMRYQYEDTEYPLSLSQLIYRMTGALLPRDMHYMDGYAPLLRKFGVKGKDVNMTVALMTVLNAVQERSELLVSEEEEPAPTEDVDELKSQIKDLREKLKRATDAAHEQERRARKAEATLSTEREAMVADRQELAGLREVVFMAGSDSETDPVDGEINGASRLTLKVSVTLPYEVKGKVLVFGGHDMWQKPMKEYLSGDIRFIDRSLLTFDTDLIKNADAIWIQTNCISHKMYYRIMEAARKWKKKVCYFLYASAKKCAEQMIMSGSEGE